ncbi:MBOAT family O-acyltransferase [Fluviicola sp.]|uniref:MBOAT family O-acyltransferase n=1 Tax=Fluviicola sp. TaxID=1917219 RepID=UPI0031DE7D13
MGKLNQMLPFTESGFFYFLLLGVALLVICKGLFSRKLKYAYVLAVISLAYIILYFTKPVQILGLMTYCYLIYLLFARVLKYSGLLIPVILLSLPMIFMKTLNILPTGEPGALHTLATIFQIAGISFMTFKVIQLYIDEGQKEERVSVLDFFNFTAFVPTLLIGPIDRFGRFKQNVDNGYESMTSELFLDGLNDLVRGLLYKFIIAHGILVLVLNQLENNGTVLFHLTNMYSYLFYLFFDFAGYSLLAIGFGKMMGIRVPINFNKPFLAVNPKDFWKRWHATLGDWLNDYFFKPIFKELTTKKKFKPIQRQNLALFLTFTLMGFWNGFELHFILSGMLFGLFSITHNYYVYRCKKEGRDVFFGKLSPKAVQFISIFLMFNSVAFAIYVFSGKISYLFDKIF